MKTYHKLKCRMFERGVTQHDIAAEIGVTQAWVNRRFTNRTPWSLQDVYAVCDILAIPYSEIGSYWPKSR